MPHTIDSLIAAWDGLGVVVRHDAGSGTWIFVALHDATLGRPVGGTRMKRYESPAEGLRDAMRLAEGMTCKWAAIEAGFGGGKAVLAVPRLLAGTAREELLRRYGRLLEDLNGSFATGVDLGTTPADMVVVGEETRYVMGVDRASGRAADPGPYTALGVFSGVRAALERLHGTPELAGRVILVQGVGDVGAPLARLFVEAKARVLITDADAGRAAAVAEATGAGVVAPDDAYGVSCDVFAPCAVGGVINRDTVGRLACRIVAGSANNQLDSVDDARRLHDRGILYVPDYLVNAGGAVAFALLHEGVSAEPVLRERVAAIGEAVGRILAEATECGELPITAARRRVEATLGRRRAGGRT